MEKLIKPYISEITNIILYIIPIIVVWKLSSHVMVTLGVYCLFLLYIILNFYPRKNNVLHLRILIISIVITIIYLNSIVSLYSNINELLNNVLYLKARLILLGSVFAIIFVLLRVKRENKSSNKEDESLFKERQADLEKLKDCITEYNIVGLKGKWGSGKTYIVELLKIELRNTYNIVEINTLMCNFDELQLNILNELERVLLENNIYTTASRKLKKQIGIFSNALSINILPFSNTKSFHSLIQELSNDLQKTSKTTLVIIEDLDRINDNMTIARILSLTEKLASTKIKILFQYSETELLSKGFNLDYIEKYIPVSMSLSSIHFVKLLKYLIIDSKFSDMKMDEFDIFKDVKLKYRFRYFKELLNVEVEEFSYFNDLSCRVVQSFLTELDKELKKYSKKIDRETTISTIFIKYFMPELFSSIKTEYEILRQFTFTHDGKTYNCKELLKNIKNGSFKAEDFKIMLYNEKNYHNYLALKLLDFDLELESIDEEYIAINSDSTLNQVYRANINEKKERIFRKYLTNACSVRTDREVAVELFIEMVLEKNKQDWDNNYNEFHNECFDMDNTYIDNSTIFLLMDLNLVIMAQALGVSNISDEIKEKAISFFIYKCYKKGITIEIIKVFNCINFETSRSLAKSLDEFNKLKVVGNMNNIPEFYYFLKNLVKSVRKTQYFNIEHLRSIIFLDINDESKHSQCKRCLEEAIEVIKKEIQKFESYNLIAFSEDLRILEETFLKLLEMFNHENKLRDDAKIKVRSTSYINNNVNEIFASIDSVHGEMEIDYLTKSYINNELTIYQTSEYLDKV